MAFFAGATPCCYAYADAPAPTLIRRYAAVILRHFAITCERLMFIILLIALITPSLDAALMLLMFLHFDDLSRGITKANSTKVTE